MGPLLAAPDAPATIFRTGASRRRLRRGRHDNKNSVRTNDNRPAIRYPSAWLRFFLPMSIA